MIGCSFVLTAASNKSSPFKKVTFIYALEPGVL